MPGYKVTLQYKSGAQYTPLRQREDDGTYEDVVFEGETPAEAARKCVQQQDPADVEGLHFAICIPVDRKRLMDFTTVDAKELLS